jgi:hypothetical protein
MMHEWDKDVDLRVCHAPNCQQHGKSPCKGVGCDGRTDEERTEHEWRNRVFGGCSLCYTTGDGQ